MQAATVFVIDDEQSVRDSIAALVELRGVPVRTFASAEDFLAANVAGSPGCVVTDLRIDPGMSGIELQQELTRRGWDIPVIVISAYADVRNAVDAMHHGAVTLLEKSCSTEALWAAIDEALKLDEARRATRRQVSALLDIFRKLTLDEVEVLVLIVTGEANKVIANQLGVSLRTIESRRAMILKKIGVGTLPELVRMYVELETALGKPLKEALPLMVEKSSGPDTHA